MGGAAINAVAATMTVFGLRVLESDVCPGVPDGQMSGAGGVVGPEEVLNRVAVTVGQQRVGPIRMRCSGELPLLPFEYLHGGTVPVGSGLVRIARFSLPDLAEQAGDPYLFGVVEGQEIAAIAGDPLYSGVTFTGARYLLERVRLLAPVIPRSKVVAVGRNYAEHAKEMGNEVPAEPLLFFKPNTSVIGPSDAVVWPVQTRQVEHEGELAVVIGRIAKDVPATRAAEVIFGYTVANDVTARDLQKSDGQWARAKGFDTFCPIGPWIETDIDPSDLALTVEVDGELRQSGRTSQMIYGIPELIEYISAAFTLLPGDLILTGTPAGVGALPPGCSVSVSIEGIGTLTNKVISRD